MGIGTILIVLLILILIGALPTWPYSSGWAPSRGLGLVLLILIILLLTGLMRRRVWQFLVPQAVDETQ